MPKWWDYDENVQHLAKAAVEYLLATEGALGGEKRAARLLFNSRSIRLNSRSISMDGDLGELTATLLFPARLLKKANEILFGEGACVEVSAAIEEAYYGLTGQRFENVTVDAALWSEPADEDWRSVAIAELKGAESATNQARVSSIVRKPPFAWNGLAFQSETETRIAKSLSEANVLFFPLAAAVAGVQKREPDFLVCADGKWGILEVQGDEFHRPETAAKEHERGRWFQRYGVRVFQIYDARRCYSNPDDVVAEFLRLLRSNG